MDGLARLIWSVASRSVRHGLLVGLFAGTTLNCLAFQDSATPAVSKGTSGTEQSASKTTASAEVSPGAAERPRPFRTIDLQPLDFRAFSAINSRDGASRITVDFIDQDRLLVTFEGTGLVRRLKACPSTHNDRIVHAVLFEYPGGKELRRSDWYVHDRRRYLWRLDPGRALLRIGDRLLIVDRELNEKPLMEVPGLAWTDVTPDGKQLILETRRADPTDRGGTDERKPSKYEVRFVEIASGSVVRTLTLDRFTPLQATSDGYADVALKSGWVWLVRFGVAEHPLHAVTRVRSVCVPDVEYSSEESMLIGRCTTAQGRYVLSSFTTRGQFLWRQRWSEQLTEPLISKAASGSRFAVSTFSAAEKQSSAGSGATAEKPDQIQQIELFNSATGTSVLRIETQPAVTAGQNFGLSPDGTSLAVLHGRQMEFYDLPKPTREEDAKFAAMVAQTPSLASQQPANDPAEDVELSSDDSAPATATSSRQEALNAPPIPPGIVALKVPGPNATDKPNGPGKPVPTFHSGAQAVVVDVLVTDGKGRPVTGLKQEDFTVAEDGENQQIRYFEEHSLDSEQPSASVADFKHATNVYSNVSSASHSDVATMVLLDTLNTPVQDQYRARDAMVRYIKDKPKTESFALSVLSSNLRLVRGFTADENELLLAIQDKRAKPNASLISQMDQTSLAMIRNFTHSNNNSQDLTRAFETSMAGIERSIMKEQLSQEEMRTHLTIDAFEQLARYLSGIPGRKNLVWLSAAFPLGKFAGNNGLDAGPFQEERDFSSRVREAMNLLASAHVSVYPIDVRGVASNTVFEAGTATPFRQNLPNTPLTSPSGTGGVPAGLGQDASTSLNMTNDHMVPRPGAVEENQEESAKRNSEHSSMDAIAEQTGGKAFYGTNDIANAVQRTVEQASDYYSLSYSPTNRAYDGRFRKIRLKLAKRGYQVSYRAGYYADDPNQPPRNREAMLKSLSLAGMTPGSPQSRQIPFEVRVVPVGGLKPANATLAAATKPGTDVKTGPDSVKLQHYVVDFAISASQLRFEPGPEGNMHGRFQLLANSFDPDGHTLSRSSSTASAEVKPVNYEQVLTEGLRLRQELDVPSQATSLRLGVEDLSSPHIGTVELALPVPVANDELAGKKEKILPPVEPD